MNPKAVRYVACPAVALFAFEAVPHFPDAYDDCAGSAALNLCSQNEDPWAIKPENHHTPHQDFEANVHSGFGYLASGGASSTTANGPMYRMTAAGEEVVRWPGRNGVRISFFFEP